MSRKTSESIPQIFSKEIIVDSENNILTIRGDGISGSTGEFTNLTASNLNILNISSSQGQFAILTGSIVTGSTALFNRITGSSGYFANNVGIGTTSASAKLEIQGGSADWNETTPGTSVGTLHLDPGNITNNFGNAITFGSSDHPGNPNEGTNAQAGIYVRSDGSYGTKMYLATTDAYVAGSKTRMMIDYNGNVGIGTTSPATKLDVNGIISIGGIPVINTINNTIDIRGNLRVLSNDSTVNQDGMYINYNSTGGGNADIRFYASGSTERMRIVASSGYTIISGDLSVSSNTGSLNLRKGTTNTIEAHIRPEAGKKGYLSFTENTVADRWIVGIENGDDALLFKAGSVVTNTERMRITGNGNVGIGTSSPATALHVQGEARSLNFSDNNGNYNVNLGNGNNEGRGIVAGYSGGSYGGIGYNIRHTTTGSTYIIPLADTANYIQFSQGFQFLGDAGTTAGRTTSFTELMRITNAGNVGIGTTSPTQAKLVISAPDESVSSAIAIRQSNALIYGFDFALDQTVNGNGYFYGIDANNRYEIMQFTRDLTPDIYLVNSSGNIGITTNTAGSKLTIGTNFASVNGITLDGADASDSQLVLRKAASKTAYSVLAWDAVVHLGAGVYYDGAAWVHNNNTANSQVFVHSPGTGILWYTSNNSSATWNVANGVRLWDDDGTLRAPIRFKNGVWIVSDTDSRNRLYFANTGTTYFGTGNSYIWRNAADTDIMSLDGTNGDLTVNIGNIIVGTSGKGIDFSATNSGVTGSATSELFSDYEEGTFTPALSASGVTWTYATNGQVGRYTKTGDKVTVSLRIAVSSVLSTGTTFITGLPYVSRNITNLSSSAALFTNSWASTHHGSHVTLGENSSTLLIFYKTAAAISQTQVNSSNIGSNGILAVTISYFTAS